MLYWDSSVVPKLMIEGGTEREKGTQFRPLFHDPHGFDIWCPLHTFYSPISIPATIVGDYNAKFLACFKFWTLNQAYFQVTQEDQSSCNFFFQLKFI